MDQARLAVRPVETDWGWPANLYKDEGFAHSDIYTNEKVFELEIERIFHKTWMYLGHESEIPNPGDYSLRTIGRQPVIFVRGKDGICRALINRCRHRGAVICTKSAGHMDQFHCWYHGWIFDNCGNLTNVPGQDAYGPDFRKEDYGLTPMPRLEEYRGFYFTSASADVQPLSEYLGGVTHEIDIAIDASPIGKIALDSGVQKTVYQGNWKHVGMDGYHPNVLHVSILKRFLETSKGKFDNPWKESPESFARHYRNGHTVLDIVAQKLKGVDDKIASLKGASGGEDYVRDMFAAYGEDRARQLIALGGDPHTAIFPNMQLIGSHVRVIIPISADETQVLMMPIRLLGVSDEINESRLRHHEMFYGSAGAGSPDDAEMFERMQQGLGATVNPWVVLKRGLGQETVDSDGSVKGRISDELPQRAQLQTWRTYMDADA